MQKSYGQHCGLASALDRVGDRWTLLLVRELLTGPKRFSELKRMLPGMASNLLTERLAYLVKEGLVTRPSHPQLGAAGYQLTPLGRALEDPVRALVRWGGYVLPGVDAGGAGVASPHWLLVAIPALLGDTAPDTLHLEAQLMVDGLALGLVVRDGLIAVDPHLRPMPDALHLEIDYRSLMAYLTGAAALQALETAGKARIRGPKMARARFETLVNACAWHRNAGRLPATG